MNIIDKITKSQMRKDLPEFRVGDSVIVGCIITETKGGKEKERIVKELHDSIEKSYILNEMTKKDAKSQD